MRTLPQDGHAGLAGRVDLDYLVCLVHLVSLVQRNKPNRPNKQDKPNNGLVTLADFFSILIHRGGG